MECKGKKRQQTRKESLSINRNIVECKATGSIALFQRAYSINRNIVECKDKDFWENGMEFEVLIET